ncbi:bifunctional 3-phenylpropionate/cinnamic acid dioxygenase ferredoxin subunit [Nesterenkonia muleiensis]|uniref:bifunctional 3-phenylpropionate/cinnamic acid dioxygenase ferredoxin subunit n=1 Tax=Nesterenkonia muleiensis TaxID=2282648 RepID=UPI001EE4EA34|nr:bifunctional 3-phenylpropionate/cinnamic acid dioxygenase ferredoxin subunit [Nesterenkonia muleiensis]
MVMLVRWAVTSTDMSLKVCSIDDLRPGEGLRIDSINPPIAVFLTEDGEVYAIDDTCTHQDASLSAGWVEDCRVECPLHESTFSLVTGQVDQPPAKKGVRTHQVHVSGGAVYVELSTAAPNLPPGVIVA